MANSQPLVSIVTPAFNAQSLLGETVASVRSQTYGMFEHIIVDDGSRDGTPALIEQLAKEDQRVRAVLLEKNVGPVEARNIGVRNAKGKYLAFLDADDLWLPEKLRLQVEVMLRCNAAISFTDYRHMSADGLLVGRPVVGPDEISLDVHFRTRFFCCSSVMVDGEKVRGFEFSKIAPAIRGEDFVTWSNVLKDHGAAARCPHDLVRYRLLPNSRSSSKVRAARSVWHLYRSVLRMSLPASVYYFISFAVAASQKHARSRPRFVRAEVDRVLR